MELIQKLGGYKQRGDDYEQLITQKWIISNIDTNLYIY